MKFPKNEKEAFEDLVQKAHEREGPHLSPQTRNKLERLADSIGYDYDNKRYGDNDYKQIEEN